MTDHRTASRDEWLTAFRLLLAFQLGLGVIWLGSTGKCLNLRLAHCGSHATRSADRNRGPVPTPDGRIESFNSDLSHGRYPDVSPAGSWAGIVRRVDPPPSTI